MQRALLLKDKTIDDAPVEDWGGGFEEEKCREELRYVVKAIGVDLLLMPMTTMTVNGVGKRAQIGT